jgi:hypothetical protein
MDLETAWQAASHDQRVGVLSHDAAMWLDMMWRMCRLDQRRQFIAGRAYEISKALDAALMEEPVESRESLWRRLAGLEQKFPHLAPTFEEWRRQLRIPARLRRPVNGRR